MKKARRGPAAHVGRPVTLTALGRTWTIARWTRARWVEFVDEFAKPRLPDPRQVASDFLKVLPAELHERVVTAAMADALEPLTPGSPRVMALLDTLDGMAYMVYLLLRPHHPDVTVDQAWDVMMEVGTRELKANMETAAGLAPRPKGHAASPACPSPAGDAAAPSPGLTSTGSSAASAG